VAAIERESNPRPFG